MELNQANMETGIWRVLKHLNREKPCRERLLNLMLLLLIDEYGLSRVAFYEVHPSGAFAMPRQIIGPHTEEEYGGLDKLQHLDLESKLESATIKTNPDLETRFTDFPVALTAPSRFQRSYETGRSFFGVDEGGYPLTDVDKSIGQIFGTDQYTLLTVKGRAGKVIGWFYGDYQFSKNGDLSKIKKGDLRHILETTSANLQIIREYEASLESKQLSALGMLAGAIAHETRNPLTSIGGLARRLLKKAGQCPTEENAGLLKEIYIFLPPLIKEVDRLEQAINQLSDLSREDFKVNYEAVNVNYLLEESLRSAKNANGHKYSIKGQDVKIWTDPNLFKGAAKNIARAAFEAMNGNGEEGLAVSIKTMGPFAYCKVSTSQCLFPQLCYSIETLGSSDLGLMVAKRIMETVGGCLDFRTDHKGTTYTLVTPLYMEKH